MAAEDKRQQKIYKGTYGKFLEGLSAPPLPYENEIKELLIKNNNKMDMKDILDAIDAPASDIIRAIYELEDNRTIRITRLKNQEIVELNT